MTAKSAPYPPCTVTVFWLKNTGRGRCLRRVTQPPHIAGPLAQIFQTHGLSPRAVYKMFCINKIVYALIQGPAPRSIYNLPSLRHQEATAIRLTILLFTGTLLSRDEQILVLTA